MTHGPSADVTYLQLQVALGVIPLISKPIAMIDDRKAITDDIVTSWLALPEETRNDYAQAGTHASAIVHFGWDYVEAVEQDDQLTPNKPFPQDPTGEQQAFNQWMKHLQLVKNHSLLPQS